MDARNFVDTIGDIDEHIMDIVPRKHERDMQGTSHSFTPLQLFRLNANNARPLGNRAGKEIKSSMKFFKSRGGRKHGK